MNVKTDAIQRIKKSIRVKSEMYRFAFLQATAADCRRSGPAMIVTYHEDVEKYPYGYGYDTSRHPINKVLWYAKRYRTAVHRSAYFLASEFLTPP